MTLPSLPPKDSENWYPHYSALDAAVRGGGSALGVNVKSYGAKGDGTTNDTAAIQAAIDAAAALGGAVVTVPPGVYPVTTLVLKSGVILSGGRALHGYRPSAVGGTVIAGTTTSTVIDTDPSNISGVGVVGLDVSGGGTAVNGIRFRNTSWCSVKAVNIDNVTAAALSIDAGQACTVEDVLVTNAVLNRSPAALTGGIELSGTDHYCNRVEVTTSLSARSGSGNVAAWAVRGSNNFLTSCVGEISDLGWYVSGDSSRFVGCRGDSNWGGDWQVIGGSNSFAACSAMNSGRPAANTYDAWTVSGLGNVFSACMVTQPGTNTYRYCYNDAVDNSVATNRNQYSACNGYGYGTAMWNTQGFLGSAPQIANTPIRVTSGTTIDVTNTQLVWLEYSTPTTVTAFNGAAEGQHLYLIGSSNVTIQASSTIYTRTGANRTLANNTVYHFVRYWGTWFETA